MKQYFPVFDRLRKEFLAGEMIWTLTDYNVLECKWKGWLKSLASPIIILVSTTPVKHSLTPLIAY